MQSVNIHVHFDRTEILQRQIEHAEFRRETFKRAMIMAQSKLDTMRRFIAQSGLHFQFTKFVAGDHADDDPLTILRHFGFTHQENR